MRKIRTDFIFGLMTKTALTFQFLILSLIDNSSGKDANDYFTTRCLSSKISPKSKMN